MGYSVLLESEAGSRFKKGFTLAELLIALMILGVIATFTIPKVLQARQDETKRAVFKENFAALNAIAYQAQLYAAQKGVDGNYWILRSDECDPAPVPTSAYCFIFSRLNAARECKTLSAMAPCFTGTDWSDFPQFPGDDNATRGALLHNGGSVVMDWAAGDAQSAITRLLIDWNGPGGPNLLGDDQLAVSANLGPNPVHGAWARSLEACSNRIGFFGCDTGLTAQQYADNMALRDWIFGQ